MEFSPSYIMELARSDFRQEADELLAELDTALLLLEASPTDGASINRAFRALHTLKGSGATAGFQDVVTIVHDVEDVFNGARSGRVEISSRVIDLVLKVGDVVRRILHSPSTDGPALLVEGVKIVVELKSVVLYKPNAAAPPPDAAPRPSATAVEEADGLWSIHFSLATEPLSLGNDPLSVLRGLLLLGQGVVRANTTRLFAERDINPERCYLSWDIQLATSATRETIREVCSRGNAVVDVRIESVMPEMAWVLPAAAYFESSMVDDFREEASEDLAEVEAHLLALEERVDTAGRVDALRRTLHNLKGLCRLVLSDVKRLPPARHPLRAMAELCHVAETFLESLGADGVLSVDASETILETVDRLKELLRANDEAREEWPGDLLERLGASGDGPHEPAVSAPSTRGAAHPHVRSVVDQCDEVMRTIDARRGPEAPLSSGDWRTLGRALGTLGQVSGFAGVTSVCKGVQTLVTLCESSSEEGAPPPLGWEAFRKQYRDVVGVLSSRPETAPASIRPRGRTVSLRPPTPAVQPSRAPQAPARAPAPQRSVRVDHEKLDVLMGAIGELLVAKNALPVLVSRVRGSDSQAGKEIKATVDRIAHIADDLQDAMRQIRMMPISSAFQRFPRMIRDLARSENKQVQLIISGDETELDKTVLEAIGDPLMHLVRNAVDHGIELPADRLAHGKPAMGTVGLEVLKEGANVVIRISDDGRGMDPARLRAKALEKGLLSEADAAGLSDKRALELIFLPGFSTAEVVTDISGRGVGMDVVQSNIRQLHGTVAIASDIGRGTVMLITLPSSLMVSKGMLVECANEKYVLPIEGVREMVKLRKDEIRQFRGVALANVRGSVCAVYSLARLLGLEERGGEDVLSFAGEEASAAIVSTSGGEIAVVVDRLVAEIDVLVKPLAGGLDRLALFQGATILGDGSVALILDVRRLDALVGGVPRDEPAVELAAAS